MLLALRYLDFAHVCIYTVYSPEKELHTLHDNYAIGEHLSYNSNTCHRLTNEHYHEVRAFCSAGEHYAGHKHNLQSGTGVRIFFSIYQHDKQPAKLAQHH